LLARTWIEDENRTIFSGPCPLRCSCTDMTGSGGVLQPDIRQGRCHEKRQTSVDEKQLQLAYAVPAGWEIKDDGKRVFPGWRLTCIGG